MACGINIYSFLDIQNNYSRYPKKELVISKNVFWIRTYPKY